MHSSMLHINSVIMHTSLTSAEAPTQQSHNVGAHETIIIINP